MYFCYFLIIIFWKRAGPFIWTNINLLNPGMLCAKFGWNWPSGSWEEVKNRKSLQTDRQTKEERWSGELKKIHPALNLLNEEGGGGFYPSPPPPPTPKQNTPTPMGDKYFPVFSIIFYISKQREIILNHDLFLIYILLLLIILLQ